MRNLILILGDQLDSQAQVLKDLDPSKDQAWMAEVLEEAEHVWSHKTRLALFFSAMRHFRKHLMDRGITVNYHKLTIDPAMDRGSSLSQILGKDVRRLKPRKIILTRPGDFRVLKALQEEAGKTGTFLEVMNDNHFMCSSQVFSGFARGRKLFRQEDFYRFMRRRTKILMDEHNRPAGERWNYDQDNRQSLPRNGLRDIPETPGFSPDRITKGVISMVKSRFATHPGSCRDFDLPVTREQALKLLEDFTRKRLHDFGTFQDVMQTEEKFLFHSRLSSSLNLKLIHPRECLEAVLNAHEKGQAPLNSVEGFIRQVLGWREYIRGIYWWHMPGYQELNFLNHDLPVPGFFWDGNTDMACVRETMNGVLSHAYAHHIQRLMVLGLFALLSGVHPHGFHQWHMGMYCDAVDWVSLPNTIGMSQYADGGIVGSKPYCASGKYIQRMSNYCQKCFYDPEHTAGSTACPFNILYWDFLDRHSEKLKTSRQINLQLGNMRRRFQDRYSRQKNRLAAREVLTRYFN